MDMAFPHGTLVSLQLRAGTKRAVTFRTVQKGYDMLEWPSLIRKRIFLPERILTLKILWVVTCPAM